MRPGFPSPRSLPSSPGFAADLSERPAPGAAGGKLSEKPIAGASGRKLSEPRPCPPARGETVRRHRSPPPRRDLSKDRGVCGPRKTVRKHSRPRPGAPKVGREAGLPPAGCGSRPAPRTGGRGVYGTGLENRRAGNRTVGSNPTPSAILLSPSRKDARALKGKAISGVRNPDFRQY